MGKGGYKGSTYILNLENIVVTIIISGDNSAQLWLYNSNILIL